jgi:S-DNA-T family DNA segregation ATPase FtsK/SpoIIIE
MTTSEPLSAEKKRSIILLVSKIGLFLFLVLSFFSLCNTRDNIVTDYYVRAPRLLESVFGMTRIPPPDGTTVLPNQELTNPIGFVGAMLAFFYLFVFGHAFSLVTILLLIIFLICRFAKTPIPLIDHFSLFVFSVAWIFSILYFYFTIHPTPDARFFFHIYRLLSGLIGHTGVLLMSIALLIASLRLIIKFNPFTLIVNFFRWLRNLYSSPNTMPIPPKTNKEKHATESDADDDVEPVQAFDYDDIAPPDFPIYDIDDVYKPPKRKHASQSGSSSHYKKPDIESFLHKPAIDKRIDKYKSAEEIKSISQTLLDKLKEFDISATVLNVNIGPIITQYELEPAPGVKVREFTSLSDDLALALKATSIRVQAPIPGRGSIGVEIPNKHSDVIYMRDILLSPEMKNHDSILCVALGKDIAGRPVVTDLARMPHLLIAGATGSGKSVCINTIICSLLLRATPEEVRLVMIDPKRIELSGYEDIPHLIQRVVTEPEDALNTLNWAVYEMEKRYELLQDFKVRDITSYNQKIGEPKKNEDALDIDRLPYIVVIVDEFADLIMTAGKEIELPITRLAQMARAVGIHLILATQRPSTKVITGVIKANFPARIAFRVSSQIDSRVILDSTGAEKLLGRGDMLFIPPGKPTPERIHGAYLSDNEIEGLVAYLHTQPKPQLDIQISKPEKASLGDFEYDDELFPEATKIVVISNTASVSMLQRHFKIGYARAGRLIDLLERAGVIGPHLGSKPREVLMTKDDLPFS